MVNGFINSTGLVLAFVLKMERFTPTNPLSIVPPGEGEPFNKLESNYNGALALDSSNNLTINTVGFLTPTCGDLGLIPTPNGITSTSSSYVVLKNISQPMICQSSFNVSSMTTLSNNTTIDSSLNVSGITIFSNNTTISGILNVSGNSNFNNSVTINSSLNVTGAFTCNGLTSLNSTIPSILLTTSSN